MANGFNVNNAAAGVPHLVYAEGAPSDNGHAMAASVIGQTAILAAGNPAPKVPPYQHDYMTHVMVGTVSHGPGGVDGAGGGVPPLAVPLGIWPK